MNREVKFRAWDYDTNTMVYPDSKLETIFCFDRVGLSIYQGNGSELSSFDLMQYTGLKDKNGVEVYEADIVEDNFGDKYEVVFEDYKFNLKGFYCGCFDIPNDGFSELRNKLKVIGNIYENIDLLEDR